jgi:O-antigen ligase
MRHSDTFATPAFAVAVLAPTLLAYNLSPSATLLNQLLSVAGWGVVLLVARARGGLAAPQGTTLWAALAALALAVIVSAHGGLPSPLATSSLALLAAAAAVAWHGAAGTPRQTDDVQAFHQALLLAGLASTVIALLQVFLPSWTDGTLIARSGLPGRAVGNLRQPNHLSSLLLWALIAWVPVAHGGRLLGLKFGRRIALGLAALVVWALVLTASRTGMVGVLLLALWGAVDKRLARWLRVALMCAPVAYLLFWGGMSAWSHLTSQTFGGEARLAENDMSSSRVGILLNTLAMIKAQPWFGVGFGEFNFAWTLSAFPGRPVAFFDHTHNLPLQLFVELGVPFGLVVLALLLWALWQAGRRALAVPGDAGVLSRAAFMVVLMIGLHSLTEYPLWYAYFLLPTAWAWGFALRREEPVETSVVPRPVVPNPALRVAGGLLVIAVLFSAYDYGKVVVIYSPTEGSGPLPERIERGQGSLFFSHHADYAAATTTEPPSQAMAAFSSTTHSLLDTRLMLAWAQALAESGHRDKASYLAARLREFRNPASVAFFEVCNDPVRREAKPPPFQCQAPPANLGWRDFLPRSE